MAEENVFEIHKKHTGVLGIESEFPVDNKTELGLAYTPGVAKVAKAIEKNPELKDVYTMSGKLVGLVTDGSAVLGLGNIGPAAGLPIVEGKALLYKDLADVNALPVAVDQGSAEEIAANIKAVSKSFAGIHLEDIAAPKCFKIEDILSEQLDIPVYHDDQEGTAIVILAALINAAKVVHKDLKDLKVLINGAGASGIATGKLLYAAGIENVTLVDIDGTVKPYDSNYNEYQTGLAMKFNGAKGDTLDEVIDGQDVFIGLSVADVLSEAQVKRMAKDPIIFALANPVPEIDPEKAKAAGAAVVATGSSKYPNQVNNILVFPGLFKGLLESGIKKVTFHIEEVVADALAGMIPNPTPDEIVPGVFDKGVVETVTDSIINLKK
ncbi:malate dehydrogenase [Fructilactobacillus lindneri]|uniref:Malate oxidoreductase n=2 Tax=Fructilactobacillus lindneri TaxID=53444 RepID=A0A0R2JM65_9LACO|nr:malic enzyme-like NAD(P)-binding protein [Fructilactobacillus lindneri]ANZ58825.1 malate dehydrogenase [Fructilactobacillus lindneri]KRN78258.1 malate oxidoreductase [Fructilactobacillus lindneri DSM 20690 = JCM 11027]POG97682.1 malate dehydrogenase [Fructilactobacillus lindneri]POH00069.1 malate dehydrogenase [Fructilactobacillus lindneri]POH02496.1 malate dehydrogenase [Fructilactobacillus lindneri]